MKPLAALSPRARRAVAWTVTGLALVLPLLAIAGWAWALAGEHASRAQRLAELRALETRVVEARAEATANPRLALIADPDLRASLRSPSAAEARLVEQGDALAARLEAAGLQPALSQEVERVTLGGVEEVRMRLTARGDAAAILEALGGGVAPDLRVFSFRLEPLGDGEARLRLVLVRATSGGDEDAD
ncbi:hypothetical protein DDZ18_03785 [Marinicauda salina]|uniref:Uncharacterized protein n=1 Tax=Marinicauda salina TaxID=2135793 RepID=A0A2U2BXH3_9PROT|nr:hypothetical protein [Marinicauda salina]PWE18723.1 hypothetical protein DDZ18_03785 [Marinicauda salina]